LRLHPSLAQLNQQYRDEAISSLINNSSSNSNENQQQFDSSPFTSEIFSIDSDAAENNWTFSHIRVLMSNRGVLSTARRFIYPVTSSLTWSSIENIRRAHDRRTNSRKNDLLKATVSNAFLQALQDTQQRKKEEDKNENEDDPTLRKLNQSKQKFTSTTTSRHHNQEGGGAGEEAKTSADLFFITTPNRQTQMLQQRAANNGDVLSQVSLQAQSASHETTNHQQLHPFAPKLYGVAERSLDAVLAKVIFPWIATAGNLRIPELMGSTFFLKEGGGAATHQTTRTSTRSASAGSRNRNSSNNNNTITMNPHIPSPPPSQLLAEKSYSWVSSVCRLAARTGAVEVLELVRRILWVAFTAKYSGNSNNKHERSSTRFTSSSGDASSSTRQGLSSINAVVTNFTSPLRFLQTAIVRKCHPQLFTSSSSSSSSSILIKPNQHKLKSPAMVSAQQFLEREKMNANNNNNNTTNSEGNNTSATSPTQHAQQKSILELETKRVIQLQLSNQFASVDAFLGRIQDNSINNNSKNDSNSPLASSPCYNPPPTLEAERSFTDFSTTADNELDLMFRPEPTADFPPVFYQIVATEQLLFIAARNRRFEVLQYLLVNPYLAATKDGNGRVLLDYVIDGIASHQGCEEDLRAATACIGVLLHARAPLSTRFVRFVMNRSSSSSTSSSLHINMRNEYHSDTLLHLAVLHDQVDVARMLLSLLLTSSSTTSSNQHQQQQQSSSSSNDTILARNRYGHGAWEYSKSFAMTRLVLQAVAQAAHEREIEFVKTECEKLLEKQFTEQQKENPNQQLIKKKIRVVVGNLFGGAAASSQDGSSNNNNNNQQQPIFFNSKETILVTIPPSLDNFFRTTTTQQHQHHHHQKNSTSNNNNTSSSIATFHCGLTSLHYVQHLWGDQGAVSSLAKLSTDILMQDPTVAGMMLQKLTTNYAMTHAHLSRRNLLSGSMTFNGGGAFGVGGTVNLNASQSSMAMTMSNTMMSKDLNSTLNNSTTGGGLFLSVTSRAQRSLQKNARRPSSDVAAALIQMNDEKRNREGDNTQTTTMNGSSSVNDILSPVRKKSSTLVSFSADTDAEAVSKIFNKSTNSKNSEDEGNDQQDQHQQQHRLSSITGAMRTESDVSAYDRRRSSAYAAASASNEETNHTNNSKQQKQQSLPYSSEKNLILQQLSQSLWERGFLLEPVDSQGNYTDVPRQTCIEKTAMNKRSVMRYALAAFAPWTVKQLSSYARRQQTRLNREAAAAAHHHHHHSTSATTTTTNRRAHHGGVTILVEDDNGKQQNQQSNNNKETVDFGGSSTSYNPAAASTTTSSSSSTLSTTHLDRIQMPWSPDQNLLEQTIESIAPFYSVVHHAEFSNLPQHQNLQQQQQQQPQQTDSSKNNSTALVPVAPSLSSSVAATATTTGAQKSQKQINNVIADAISSTSTHASPHNLLASIMPQSNQQTISCSASSSSQQQSSSSSSSSMKTPVPPSSSAAATTSSSSSPNTMRDNIFSTVGRTMNMNASSLRFASLVDLLKIGDEEESKIVQTAASVWSQSLTNKVIREIVDYEELMSVLEEVHVMKQFSNNNNNDQQYHQNNNIPDSGSFNQSTSQRRSRRQSSVFGEILSQSFNSSAASPSDQPFAGGGGDKQQQNDDNNAAEKKNSQQQQQQRSIILVPWYSKGFKDEHLSAEVVEKLMAMDGFDDDEDAFFVTVDVEDEQQKEQQKEQEQKKEEKDKKKK